MWYYEKVLIKFLSDQLRPSCLPQLAIVICINGYLIRFVPTLRIYT